MNNLDLRQAIIQRVQGKTDEDLIDVIESSIGNDERTLPGLGVLFEMIWKETDQSAHSVMIHALNNSLQKQNHNHN